jgi:hypothetical protein
MKKKCLLAFWAVLALVPLILILINACNSRKNKDTQALLETPTVLQQADTLDNGLVLPTGTAITIFSSKPKAFHVQFPGQYRFVGFADTFPVQLDAMDVTCTCTSGTTGCTPYKNSKFSGCISSGNCSVCKQKNSAFLNDADVPLTEGAIINLAEPIHFITSKNDAPGLAPVYPSMLSDSFIVRSLRDFLNPYQKDNTAFLQDSSIKNLPEGYAYMPVNLFGRSIIVPVQVDLLGLNYPSDFTPGRKEATELSGDTENSFAGGYGCSCSSGTTGCEYHDLYLFWLGWTYFCNAKSCISCTLHTPN